MTLSGKGPLLVLVFLLWWSSGKTQNLFNAENSKEFARYLFNTQQYELAATEYERILTIDRTDTNVYRELLETYRFGNSCSNSFNNLQQFRIDRYFSNTTVATEYLKLALTCNCCFNKNNFSEALSNIGNEKQVFYQLGNYMLSNHKDSLSKLTFHNYHILSNSYPDLLQHVERIEAFKRKSPGLAMAMSTVLPGSGKAYSGYWGDAVMSLVFVASNAWVSYRGFNKKGAKSPNGWIFGSISLGFYLGNIWGSGKAAHTYNQIEYDKLYNEAKNNIYSHF